MTYDMDEIRRLLNRYMDGATSQAEQERLEEFFRSDEVPEDLEDYRAMFRAFDVDALAFSEEEKDAIMAVEGSRFQWGRMWRYTAVAAAVVFAFFIGKSMRNSGSTSVPEVQYRVETKTVEKLKRDTVIVERTLVVEKEVVVADVHPETDGIRSAEERLMAQNSAFSDSCLLAQDAFAQMSEDMDKFIESIYTESADGPQTSSHSYTY